jgi:ComF family protein
MKNTNPFPKTPNFSLELLWNLLFPRRCPVCNDVVIPKGHLICPTCIPKLSLVKEPTCRKCGKEMIIHTAEYCFDCTKHKRTFEYGKVLLNYNDTAKTSMSKIKYNNKREYLDFYGEAICRRYKKQIARMNADALVPVPIHKSRKRERGFNQAEVLADKISKHTGIPVFPDALLRSKKTAPQKVLNPGERLKNLEEAFLPGQIPQGINTVILIDDIYTTGSTIEACTRALRRAGVKKIYFLTICIGRGQ